MSKSKPAVLIISSKRNARTALALSERINRHGLHASVAALAADALAPADVLHAAQTATAVLVASTTAGADLVRSIATARGVLLDAKLTDESAVLKELEALTGAAWRPGDMAEITSRDTAEAPPLSSTAAGITWREAMRHGCGAALPAAILGFVFTSPVYFLADRSDRMIFVIIALCLVPPLVFLVTTCIYKVMGNYPKKTPLTVRLRHLLAVMGIVFAATFIFSLIPIVAWLLSMTVPLGWFLNLVLTLCLTSVTAFLAIVPMLGLHGLALWLTARHPRVRVLSALTATPFLAVAALALAWFHTNSVDMTQDVETELVRVGFRPYYDEAKPDQDTLDHAIRQFEISQNWPERGAVNKQLLRRLQALPDKTDWIVAADGSGDARSLEEVVNRAGLDARIIMRPGVYRITTLDMSSRDTFKFTQDGQRIFNSRGTNDVDFHISGMNAANVVLELDDQSRVVIGQGDTMENLTMRHIRDVADVDMVSITGGGATLKNTILESRSDATTVRILTSSDGVVIEGNRVSHPRGTGLGVDAPGAAQIRANEFRDGLHSAIVVFGDSKPIVENNQISNVRSGHGIHVYGDAGGEIIGNRISQTTSSAISIDGNSNTSIRNNIIRRSYGCIQTSRNARAFLIENDLTSCSVGDYYALYASGNSVMTLRRNREDRPPARHASAPARITVEN